MTIILWKILSVVKQMLLVSLLRNGQFYIRNFMLNKNIQIILKKSSSVLSTLFLWIDFDKFGNLGTWDTLFSKLSTMQGKNTGFIWFDFYYIGLWLYMV